MSSCDESYEEPSILCYALRETDDTCEHYEDVCFDVTEDGDPYSSAVCDDCETLFVFVPIRPDMAAFEFEAEGAE